MTDGEKALHELGYNLDSNSSKYSNEIEYVKNDYCISYYGWNLDGRIFIYTVSAYECDTSEPMDLDENLLKAILLRLQELNQAVI